MHPLLVGWLFVNWLINLVRKIGNEVQCNRLDNIKILESRNITKKEFPFFSFKIIST